MTHPEIVRIDKHTRVADVLSSAEAVELIAAEAPELISPGSEAATSFAHFPVGIFLKISLGADHARAARILSLLSELLHPAPPAPEVPPVPVSFDFDTAPRGSAMARVSIDPSTDRFVEITLNGPAHGNPFIDVDLTATFEHDRSTLTVGGFYDGDGVYRIRCLAPFAGVWTFSLTSNAQSLDGVQGSFTVAQGSSAGPVRASRSGFSREDKAAFAPFGTTSYAWIHQGAELQLRTLDALKSAPFNKLRMCLFPKAFIYNSNDPDNFVFPRTSSGWDQERFDLEFFRRLEERIDQLGDAGIEAELILFHPYDRWGFAAMGATSDDRYVRYVVRRLGAYTNVWWSMANEYELLTAKRDEDWDRLGRLVAQEDHVGHPVSIHNIVEPWDADSEWVTHCSIQLSDPSIGEKATEWINRWPKPVIVDEMGYEGNLDQGWGNLTGEEIVIRLWQLVLRGAFGTHGETFWSPDEVIFWSKGGELVGESIPRIAFLRQIVDEIPSGRVEPQLSQFDATWGGEAGQCLLIHFGRGRPLFRDVHVPDGYRARIDVIDAWRMTIDTLPDFHKGTVRVDLPARQHIVLRLRLEPAD